MRVTAALIASVAAVVAASGIQTVSFTVVTGPGFEGAIVPATAVSGSQLQIGEIAWTPSSDHVRAAEAELIGWLRQVARSPESANPPMPLSPTIPPRNVEEVRELIAHMNDIRRLYSGRETASGASPKIDIQGFPKGEGFEDWRVGKIPMIFDVGCAIWFATFDVTTHKIESFGCSGSA